jgi:hypothetical protein
MIKIAKAPVLTLCLAGLAACGPLNEGKVGSGLLGIAQDKLGLAPEAPAAPAIPPEIANAAPGEVLLVTIRARNAVAPLVKAAQNGGTITWISPGEVTMTFQDGILIGTRGLNDDLMGADVAGVRAAIDAGGGTATRRHSYLDPEDQILTRDLTCTITRVGPEEVVTVNGTVTAVRFDEDCTGAALVFENKYWMDGATMIRSNQAVSAGVGFIQADQL